MQPAGKTFLITGGAAGLGAATARMLTAAGARVALVDLNAEAAAALAAELGTAAASFPADVADATALEQAVLAARDHFGALHGLIACAGIAPGSRLLGKRGPHPLDLFEKALRVNLVGAFNAARLVAAALDGNEPDAEGERGLLLFTASIAAWEGQIGQAAYAASKAGITGLVLPLARELAGRGIRCLAIAPGVFDTPLMAAMTDDVRASLAAQIPFPPRFGRPEEFASLVRQIIENPLLNGSVIRLDGALRMGAK